MIPFLIHEFMASKLKLTISFLASIYTPITTLRVGFQCYFFYLKGDSCAYRNINILSGIPRGWSSWGDALCCPSCRREGRPVIGRSVISSSRSLLPLGSQGGHFGNSPFLYIKRAIPPAAMRMVPRRREFATG